MDPRPRVAVSTDAYSLAVCKNLLVSVWRTEVSLAGIQATDIEIRSLLAAGYEQYGSLTVIERELSMRISEEARSASTALQNRYKTKMRCSAYLVESNTFALAAVRTMTAGMSLMTRSPYPIRAFSDALEASAWVAKELDMGSSSVAQAIQVGRGA